MITNDNSTPKADDEINGYIDTVKCLQHIGEMKKGDTKHSKFILYPHFTNSNGFVKHSNVKDVTRSSLLNAFAISGASAVYNMKRPSSTTSISTFSTITNDPAILPSSLLREIFMALVGAQIIYIVANVIANCDAAAIIAGSVAIQAIICHLDARPMSYWVSAILSINAAIALVLSLFLRFNGLEQLQLDPVLKRMTIFYASMAVIFACICCYLATTFARLISHEKKCIQKSLERIKTDEEVV